MSFNISTGWPKLDKITFRILFCYLIFYFLFLSNFSVGVGVFPWIAYIHFPFSYISDSFIGLINRLFIHTKYDANIYTGLADTSWFIIASLTYLVLSLLITAIWTFFHKRTNYKRLFLLLQTYCRYYLAFVLFLYGLDKLFLNQFPPPTPDNLVKPLSNIDLHTLLWTCMGASKSYNFFTGSVETLAASFLLFKRTTVLGALIALGTLINILFLDIAYDTLVKSLIVNLILIALFIISPDIKQLIKFFFLKANTSLTNTDSERPLVKNKWLYYPIKFGVIIFVLFVLIKREVVYNDDFSKKYLGGLDGIYRVEEFHFNNHQHSHLDTNTEKWKSIAINKFGVLQIQLMNDSSFSYVLKGDTTTKTLQLTVWNDSTFKSKLNYSMIPFDKYRFEGLFATDSIKVICKKINLENSILLRDKGKMKWLWW